VGRVSRAKIAVVLLTQKRQHMKIKHVASSRPRLISTELAQIADNLAHFAVEFGVTIYDELATIGFANGVRLRIHAPNGAAELEALLAAAESVPPDEELVGLIPALLADFLGEGDWTRGINRFLRERWRLWTDDASPIEPHEEALLRILHGIRFGLLVARRSPETAHRIEQQTETLGFEQRFLSQRLDNWSDSDWKPSGLPFVEFTASFYDPGSIQQRIIRNAVSEVLPFAKALSKTWSLSLWIEWGWSGGRGFVRNNPKDCKALLAEVGQDHLKMSHEFYQRWVLGTVRSDGEVQIERATLKYIGDHPDPNHARCYCTGGEPRVLARLGFEFAFWMGIFSSHPVPIIEH